MVSSPNHTSPTATEKPAFLDVEGRQFYHVLHTPAAAPKACVVLAGPFATERPYSYTPWVRWARYLADAGFVVYRFDYRGVGESTGSFIDATLVDWIKDVEIAVEAVRAKFPDLPILLHGLGIGGVLASQYFRTGSAHALLLWSAPNTAQDSLKEGFMRRLAVDFGVTKDGKKKTWADYLQELNDGIPVPVQGYPITGKLWHTSATCRLSIPGQGEAKEDQRPCRVVRLDKTAAPLIAGIGQWRALNPALRMGYVPLDPDLSALFFENRQWLESTLVNPAA